jgi:protein-tyrosine phosphatase
VRRYLTSKRRKALGLAALLGVSAVLTTSCSSGTAAPAPSVSNKVIPFTSATVTEEATGAYSITWRAPSSAGKVSIFAGTNPLVDATTDKVGSGASSASIVVTPPPTNAARWYFTLTPAKGAPLILADRSLDLADAPNFRDVGGYRTADGQWVRMGLLYRSGSLNNLTSTEQQELSALGLVTVVDLRTGAERASSPDKLAAATHYVVANVLAGSPNLANVEGTVGALVTTSDKQSTTMADATGIMTQLYNQLPVLASANSGYAHLFDQVATTPAGHALVFHCTAGKDRTGWATAALLLELGVPMPTVEQDYMLSNQYVLPSYRSVVTSYVADGGKAPVLDAILGVQPQYLADSIAVMNRRYGSVENYFKEGLGLDSATIAALKSHLLEGSPN